MFIWVGGLRSSVDSNPRDVTIRFLVVSQRDELEAFSLMIYLRLFFYQHHYEYIFYHEWHNITIAEQITAINLVAQNLTSFVS